MYVMEHNGGGTGVMEWTAMSASAVDAKEASCAAKRSTVTMVADNTMANMPRVSPHVHRRSNGKEGLPSSGE